MLGSDATPEMTQIALANVAEWAERASLVDHPSADARRALFASFSQLQATVGADYGWDWAGYQASTAYANDAAAQRYETERDAVLSFVNTDCDRSMTDLRDRAEARAVELIANLASEPSTVIESDSLPGHSIFTHSSGRLIASFPTAWEWEERSSEALIDLVASPDIARFLSGDAIDGVRLQLVEATTLGDFRSLIAETMVASSCSRTEDLADDNGTRIDITQTFACADHGASVIGQFKADAGLGLIIEASFDGVDASRADLIRLASIANSALWF